MALIGYARVSTADQDPQLQVDALTLAGCDRIFVEHASGARTDRPELAACLDYARRDDTLTVWRLDRLGRSLPHLITTVNALGERGIGFRSLGEAIDTTTAGGRLIFHIFGAVAQFQRELTLENTAAGLAAAAASGKKGGRQPVDERRIGAALQLLDSGRPVAEVARTLGLGRSTLYRYLQDSAEDQLPA